MSRRVPALTPNFQPHRSVRLTRPTTLVLFVLSRGVRHGFDVLDATGLPSGTVYPILRRLEDAGAVRSQWEPVRIARQEGRPPRRYYELTGAGAQSLRAALLRHPDVPAAVVPDAPPHRA